MLFDYEFKNYNYRLILYILILNILGVLVINSVTGQDSAQVNKQIMGIVVGLLLAVSISLFDYHRISRIVKSLAVKHARTDGHNGIILLKICLRILLFEEKC